MAPVCGLSKVKLDPLKTTVPELAAPARTEAGGSAAARAGLGSLDPGAGCLFSTDRGSAQPVALTRLLQTPYAVSQEMHTFLLAHTHTHTPLTGHSTQEVDCDVSSLSSGQHCCKEAGTGLGGRGPTRPALGPAPEGGGVTKGVNSDARHFEFGYLQTPPPPPKNKAHFAVKRVTGTLWFTSV